MPVFHLHTLNPLSALVLEYILHLFLLGTYHPLVEFFWELEMFKRLLEFTHLRLVWEKRADHSQIPSWSSQPNPSLCQTWVRHQPLHLQWQETNSKLFVDLRKVACILHLAVEWNFSIGLSANPCLTKFCRQIWPFCMLDMVNPLVLNHLL